MKAVRCSVWNSDKVRWGSRCLIVLMAAALLLGATWIGYAEENEVETGDIDLRDVMTFEEAEQLLQEDGLEPIMAATKRNDKWERAYSGRDILGHTASKCILEGVDGEEGWFSISYLFDEEGQTDGRNPGEIYLDILNQMKKELGESTDYPGALGIHSVWDTDEHRSVKVDYMTVGVPKITYTYRKKAQ